MEGGRYEAAEQLYESALRSVELLLDAASDDQHSNDRHTRLAVIRCRIQSAQGDLLRLQGHYTDAEALLRSVLSDSERLTGMDSVETAQACVNLGVVCKYLGRLDESRQLYLRALPVLTRQYGEASAELVPLY